jgi:hypothetical protein
MSPGWFATLQIEKNKSHISKLFVVSSVWCAQLGLADGTEHAVKTTVCIAGLHP